MERTMPGSSSQAIGRRRAVTGLLLALVLIYAGVLLAWVVGRSLWGDRWLMALILSQMGPWLFFPALFLAVGVLLSRQVLGAVLLLVPAGLFLWFYGGMLLPAQEAPEPAVPLTVMTFNLQATNAGLDAVVRLLESTPTDVLAMQEVHDWQHRALSDALADRYPYRWRSEGEGLALYSAYPMVARQIYEVSAPGGAEPIWPIQSVVLQIEAPPGAKGPGEIQVHVINAHLARTGIVPLLGSLNPEPMRSWSVVRAAQIERIEEVIRERGLPAIVACDGNMTDLTAAYDDLAAELQDAWRERGWGFGNTLLVPRSFEVRSPINVAVQRIDYLLASPEVGVARVRVVTDDSGSDHRPVWGLFDLAPAPAD